MRDGAQDSVDQPLDCIMEGNEVNVVRYAGKNAIVKTNTSNDQEIPDEILKKQEVILHEILKFLSENQSLSLKHQAIINCINKLKNLTGDNLMIPYRVDHLKSCRPALNKISTEFSAAVERVVQEMNISVATWEKINSLRKAAILDICNSEFGFQLKCKYARYIKSHNNLVGFQQLPELPLTKKEFDMQANILFRFSPDLYNIAKRFVSDDFSLIEKKVYKLNICTSEFAGLGSTGPLRWDVKSHKM